MAGTLTSGHERTGASFVGATTWYVDKGLLHAQVSLSAGRRGMENVDTINKIRSVTGGVTCVA